MLSPTILKTSHVASSMAPGVHRLLYRDLRGLRGPVGTGPAPGSSEELSQIVSRIASIGASEVSDWRVGIEHLSHKTSRERNFYRVRLLNDCPGRVFHVFQNMILEGDDNMLALLDLMKKFSVTTSLTIEGHQVRLGDFKIRLGRLAQGNNPLAMFLDIEYIPFTTLSDHRWPGMEELANDVNEIAKTLSSSGAAASALSASSSSGLFVAQEPANYKMYQLGDEVSWAHYVLDYVFSTAMNQKK